LTYRKLRIDNPIPNGGTLLSGNYEKAL
jgi:hypothetical protein